MDDMAETLRGLDRTLYFSSLFVAEGKRRHVQALYAFAAEIARIPFLVSEPQLGEIRLQWWLDTLDGIYHGDPQDHPIAAALREAIGEGDLPQHALANLVKAHQFDLYSDLMPTLNDLEGYLGETVSAVIQMAASVMRKEEALECAEAAGLAGVGYGMARLLCTAPVWLSRGTCFIPAELLAARNLKADEVVSAENEAAAGLILSELRHRAQQRLNEARRVAFTIRSDLRAAFLPAALTDVYLKTLAKKGRAALTKPTEVSQLRLQWELWKAARTESF